MRHPAEPLELAQPPFSDAEVRAFIEAAPRTLTYTGLAAAVEQRFGRDRAWSADQIARYWLAIHRVQPGAPGRVESDSEIRAFLDDRLGRFSLTELAAACRARFGDRAPSRAAIGRYWQRQRQQTQP